MIRVAKDALWCAALACLLFGCEPEVVAGAWTCGSAPLVTVSEDSGMPAATSEPIVVPWSTSFEDGFCGYAAARGFCYSDPDATYRLAGDVVRTGRRAAAFSISTDPEREGLQARCVREGILPTEAYYGAWFYVPIATSNEGNWNLMHFRGWRDGDLHGLWDVSIDDAEDDRFSFVVRDFAHPEVHEPEFAEVGVGEWFRVDFYLRRAADATGEVALYVNGQQVLVLSDIETDDSVWGQWYVGNLGSRSALRPSESVVYVDDVSIRDTL